MTAGTPRPRLTKADEKAIAALLADADQAKVNQLAVAINKYEMTVTEAKARLGRRKALRPLDRIWQGGYAAAMQTVINVLGDLGATRADPRDAVLAVIAVAAGACDLYYAYGVPESWSGDAS